MIIRADKLSKWYGQVAGVNDLSFETGPGVTGFLGPNGAGKTTLLRLLTGQLRPSGGMILMDGIPVWNNWKILKNVGYCPEMDVFWNYMSGRRFVSDFMRIHGFGRDEAEERARKAIETMGMEKDQDRKIGSYSRGMRQRIKLAQAIAHDPQVLLLDEPLNGMDPLGRHKAMQLIRRFGEGGRTVIVSSHVLHEIEEMTDTILIINHGSLLAAGNIYEIRKLIDAHPLQVSIVCDDVKKLTARLLEYGDVTGVQFDRRGGCLTVETTDPDEFHRRLPAVALDNGISVRSIWSPDENLEAVFDYLVR